MIAVLHGIEQVDVVVDGLLVDHAIVLVIGPLLEVLNNSGILAPLVVGLHLLAFHLQVGGVAVRAEPTDMAHLTLESPTAPRAGAVPVTDGLGITGTLEDHCLVGVGVTLDIGVNAIRRKVFHMHSTLTP